MEDNWENSDLVTTILPKKIDQNDDDVKDNWEDSDEEEKAPTPPPPQTSKATKDTTTKKPNLSKIKAKTKGDEISASSDVPERQLTAQEVEELKRKADLEHFADTFGVTVEQKEAASVTSSSTTIKKEITFSSLEPSTKEEFKSYCQFLINEINRHKKKKEYYEFLSELFRALSLDLDSEHVRRFSKELSILAGEMQKREKENERQKQPKSSKKPAIVVGKRGVLDDFAEDGYYGGGGGDDDEDFI